jgi:hypothetical protein
MHVSSWRTNARCADRRICRMGARSCRPQLPRGASLTGKTLAPHRALSFRGSAAPHRRVPHTRGATEKSTVGMPVDSFGARHWPCPDSSRPHVRCGLPRRATQSPRVDFSALPPASRAESAARPGLEMTHPFSSRRARATPTSYRKPPLTPRPVISRERRTSPAGTPHPWRDREIYCRYVGGQLRRPALALSGLVATACLVRAAASGHAVAESRFLGPATRVASRKCSAAGPRNDTSVFIPQGACDAHPVPKTSPYTAHCHFEGAPHLTGGYPTPVARPRNLLSVCRWPASAPGTGPVRTRRDRMSGAGCRVRPRSSRE